MSEKRNLLTWWDVFKMVIAALVSIFGIYYTQHLSRSAEFARTQYLLREANYKELVRSLKGFYIATENKELKDLFIEQVSLCWLYAPDPVIELSYDFMEKVAVWSEANDSESKLAIGRLMAAIRNDLLQGEAIRSTSLTAESLRHYRSR